MVIEHDGPRDLRVGIDVVKIGRMHDAVVRHGATFATRIFREAERAAFADARADPDVSFAAKEAFVKAIGTGVVSGVAITDLEALDPERGLEVHGLLAHALQRVLPSQWWSAVWRSHGCQVVITWLGRAEGRQCDI